MKIVINFFHFGLMNQSTETVNNNYEISCILTYTEIYTHFVIFPVSSYICNIFHLIYIYLVNGNKLKKTVVVGLPDILHLVENKMASFYIQQQSGLRIIVCEC